MALPVINITTITGGAGGLTWVFTDGDTVVENHNFSIGHPVSYIIEVNTVANPAGRKIYFADSYYCQLHTTPSGYWVASMPNVLTVGDTIAAIWIGSVNGRNGTVTITVEAIDTTDPMNPIYHFNIEHDFYYTADPKGFISNSGYNNHDYFLKNAFDNPAELSNIYFTDGFHSTPAGQYKFTTFLTDVSNVPITQQNTFPVGTLNLMGRWYNQNVNNGGPTFPLNNIQLRNKADTADVTSLSPFENRLFKIFIDNPFGSGANLTGLLAYMIRTDKLDNSVDYFTNYEMSPVSILTDPSISNYGNSFASPMVLLNGDSPIVPGELNVVSKWFIRKDTLTPGARYRIIVVLTTDNVEQMQSYISNEYNVTTVAEPTPLDINSELTDYNNYSNAYVRTVVQDRLCSTLKLNTPFSNYVTAVIATIGQTPIIIPRTVELIISTSPAPNVKHILQYNKWTFLNWIYDTGLLKYRANFGAPGDGTVSHDNDINHSFLSDDGITLNDFAGIFYDLRMRYEGNVPAYQSFVNGNPVVVFGTQDWRGKKIDVQWNVTFEFGFMIGGQPAAYGDIHSFNQAIDVTTWETDLSQIFSIQLFDEFGNVLGDICKTRLIEVLITLNASILNPTDYNLFPMIDVVQYGINNLQEGDLFVNDIQLLPTLTSAFIIAGEDTFQSDNTAFFLIDATLLQQLKQYRISCLVKYKEDETLYDLEFREDGTEELRENDSFEYRQ